MPACTTCGHTAVEAFAFCPGCGSAAGGPSVAGAEAGETTTATPGVSWRDVARTAKQAATPLVQRAAGATQRLYEEHAQPPAAPSEEPAGGGAAKTMSPAVAASAPVATKTVAEKAGRGVGAFGGHVTRSLVGTATAPVVDTVWHERPNLPIWQKILGALGWAALIFTPLGWVLLAVTFIVMVVLGNYNPYTWAVWLTKWGGVFVVLAIVFVILAIVNA